MTNEIVALRCGERGTESYGRVRCRCVVLAGLLALGPGLAGTATAAALPGTFVHLGASGPIKDAPNPAIGDDGRVGVMLVLDGEAAVADYRRALTAAGGKGPVATAAAGAASKRAVAQLQSRQAAVMQSLHARHIAHDELFRAQRVVNGIALRVDPADIEALAALPGVAAVKYLPLERLSNITSVPFIDAPQAWTGVSSLGLPADATGEGVRVGIIDTGIDYQHPDFGGSGSLVDYQRNADRTRVNAQFFPNAKVVGGMDFVGDGYNGANVPHPDPNPMDCNGHGSHVAGTVGGYGVKNDGSTYLAGYDPLPDYAGLRIGPGVAPGAQLYALRVFGCGGGTNVLTQAIEWAMDPDGDGDVSDHLDVINMSLGSPLGFASDVDAVAADAAAAAGVIVVAAAGNDGDAFFTHGSPAAGRHVISAAASVDGGIAGALLSETAPAAETFAAVPGAFANADQSLPPNVSGQSGTLVAVDDGEAPVNDGCSPTYANDVAGKIALITRGNCAFSDKILNAQANGAIGVVVVDNDDSAVPVTMGGLADPPITIPALSVASASGAILAAQLSGGAVSVALNAASAGDTFAAFSSRGPGGDLDGSVALKPDLAAPGFNIPSAQTGVTCNDAGGPAGCITPATGGYIPGGQLLVLSGTSMATPHVAGLMALLRQLHPDAGVDDLKALAMNTASHDVFVGAEGSGPRYGARSVGAGRVDAARAATGTLTLANDDVAGATSVTFDVDPVGDGVATHAVRISNHAAFEQTVNLVLEDLDDAPGVQFTIEGASQITLPANGSAVATIAMTTHANAMTRRRDPTIPSNGILPVFDVALPRAWLTEQSSLLKIVHDGGEVARLPVYAALRPHSALAGALSGAVTAATAAIGIDLAGTHVCTAALVPTASGPACTADPASGEVSALSAFELQLSAPRDPELPAFASVHYVGVNYVPDPQFGDLLLFGLATYGKWNSPSEVAYNVCIDSDGDGSFDKLLYNTDFGALQPIAGVGPPATSDAYLSVISDGIFFFTEFPLNLIDAQSVDTGVLDNNVMVLGAAAADLGIAPGTTIHYGVAVCPAFDPQCTRLTILAQPATHCGAPDAIASFDGPYTYDTAHPGIDGQGHVLLQDIAGDKVELPYDEASLGANGSLGLLLLHHHNRADGSAQVIVVDDVFGGGFD